MGFGFGSDGVVAGGSLKHKRDPSYTGVRDLFMDEEEEEAPIGQEARVADLRAEIDRQKKRIQELQKYESTNFANMDQIDSLEEELEQRDAQLKAMKEKMEQKEAEHQREIDATREEMLNSLKQAGSTGDVSDLIQNELERTKKKLQEKDLENQKLRNLQDQASGKDVEIKHLKNTLQEERQVQKELQFKVEDADRQRQEAVDKLKIIQESHAVNEDKDALVNERLRNKTLENTNKDLTGKVGSLEKTISSITESKISLVKNAAVEIDRLRTILQNVCDGSVSIQSSHTIA